MGCFSNIYKNVQRKMIFCKYFVFLFQVISSPRQFESLSIFEIFICLVLLYIDFLKQFYKNNFNTIFKRPSSLCCQIIFKSNIFILQPVDIQSLEIVSLFCLSLTSQTLVFHAPRPYSLSTLTQPLKFLYHLFLLFTMFGLILAYGSCTFLV